MALTKSELETLYVVTRPPRWDMEFYVSPSGARGLQRKGYLKDVKISRGYIQGTTTKKGKEAGKRIKKVGTNWRPELVMLSPSQYEQVKRKRAAYRARKKERTQKRAALAEDIRRKRADYRARKKAKIQKRVALAEDIRRSVKLMQVAEHFWAVKYKDVVALLDFSKTRKPGWSPKITWHTTRDISMSIKEMKKHGWVNGHWMSASEAPRIVVSVGSHYINERLEHQSRKSAKAR